MRLNICFFPAISSNSIRVSLSRRAETRDGICSFPQSLVKNKQSTDRQIIEWITQISVCLFQYLFVCLKMLIVELKRGGGEKKRDSKRIEPLLRERTERERKQDKKRAREILPFRVGHATYVLYVSVFHH